MRGMGALHICCARCMLLSLFVVIVCCHRHLLSSLFMDVNLTSDQRNGRSRYGLVLNFVVIVPLCHRLLLYNGGLGVVVIVVVVVPSPPCRRRGGVVAVIIATISSLLTFLVGCCVMGGVNALSSSLRASYAVVIVARCRHRRCR